MILGLAIALPPSHLLSCFSNTFTKQGEQINLNGELTVDFPEDVKIPVEPNQMVTAEVVGSQVKFSYCSLRNAMPFGLAFAEQVVDSANRVLGFCLATGKFWSLRKSKVPKPL
ncbi:MAG: hypothetical protein KME09_09100 [Pleurocapsa minor HA4230-MV1]|jgi:hypothetical protein|nr:hypothetical protein [Pleurocapsa minor HA4230-MV1]